MLVAGTGGVYTATLGSSLVYIGSNRIATVVGTNSTSSTFTYDPTTPDFRSPATPELTASGIPVSDVVGIQTRVQGETAPDGNSVWGIQVGTYLYEQVDHSVHNGMQLLLLKRSDLSLVSNTIYDFGNSDQVQAFANDIAPGQSKVDACGAGGCLEIIESLTTAIPNFSSYEAYSALNSNLPSIGGTRTFIVGGLDTTHLTSVAYSFVGNVGAKTLAAGVNFERVTCSASSGCPTDYAAHADEAQSGLVPNGADGVVPNLNSTGATGFTNLPATTSLPAITVSNNGAMAGELILDNNNTYTFTYTEPPIHYAMGRDPNNTNVNALELRAPSKGNFRFPDGTTRVFLDSHPLPPTPGQAEPGGFQLAIFDATTLQLLANNTYVVNPATCVPPSGSFTCTGPDGSQLFPLADMQYHIQGYNSRRAIFFLQSLGNLQHDCPAGQSCEANNTQRGGLPIQDIWNSTAQAIQDVGGTFATFDLLDNPSYTKDPYDQYSPNTRPTDDYQMVGQWWLPHIGVTNPYAKEESSQINRQTIAAGGGARMTGLLEKERDGYFRATLEGNYGEFFPKSTSTLLAAPLLPPVAWPLTSPSNSAGVQAAYAWTSQQLLKCITNCTDLRGAYSNLNQDPAVWLALLVGLQPPADCTTTCSLGFTSSDFETVQSQLETEIQYVANIREYQGNLLGLLQAEQSNRGLILQQEADALTGTATIDLNTTSSPGQNWRSYTTDAFHLLGPVASLGSAVGVGAGFIAADGIVAAAAPYALPAVAVVSAIGIAALDVSAKKTNEVNGAPIEQQEHELYASSQLAGQLADQYAEILITVGHDFNRIYADWGRLSAIGSTITNNNLPWSDDATGKLLKTFDLTARRQFLRILLPSGYQVSHYTYASPGLNPYFGQVFHPDGPRSYMDGTFYFCGYDQWLLAQLAANPTDPNTNDSRGSYMFIPGAPIDGPGVPNPNHPNLTNRYPFDLWWDIWTIQETQYGRGNACTITDSGQNPQPANSLFLSTGMFQPLDPDNPNALGLYKVWLFQRDLASVVFEPVNANAHDDRTVEGSNFWNYQITGDQSLTFPPYTLGYPLPIDPRSY